MGRHEIDKITDTELLDFMREVSPVYNKHAAEVRKELAEAIAERRRTHVEELQKQLLPKSLLPSPSCPLLGWYANNLDASQAVTPHHSSKRLRAAPYSSALAKGRTSRSPLGGRPEISIQEVIVLRHLLFAGGVTGSNLATVEVATGYLWEGELPELRNLASRDAIRYHIMHLALADRTHDAMLVNKVLNEYPFAAMSCCYDATIHGANTKANLFLRGPVGRCLQQLRAILRNIFIGFTVTPSKSAKSMAEMNLERLRNWCKVASHP